MEGVVKGPIEGPVEFNHFTIEEFGESPCPLIELATGATRSQAWVHGRSVGLSGAGGLLRPWGLGDVGGGNR